MTCKHCKSKFKPKFFLQKYCLESEACIAAWRNVSKEKAIEKQRKLNAVQKKKDLDSLMTKSEWLKLAQTVFNLFIRTRDAGQKCISCDCSMQGRKGDASHYFPSTYSALRFDEDNVHLACVPCNQFKSGNLHEYRPRLIKKIGVARVKWLDDHAHDKFEITIPEIKELITEYRQKIKQLKTN